MGNLADRLIEARTDKGWTKADLRREARLKSPSTLTELENGSRTQSPQLPVIASALGVEVLWLQHGTGPKHRIIGAVYPVSKFELRKGKECSITEEVVSLMTKMEESGKLSVRELARALSKLQKVEKKVKSSR